MHAFILVLDLIRSLRLYFIWLSFLGFSVFLFPREYFLFSRQYVEALNRPIWFVNPTSPIGRLNQCRAIQQPVISETDIFILSTPKLVWVFDQVSRKHDWPPCYYQTIYFLKEKTRLEFDPSMLIWCHLPERGLCRVIAHRYNNNFGTCE